MKNLIPSFRPAAVVVTFALIATPAFAQHERESNRDGQQRGEQSRRGNEQRGDQSRRGNEQRGEARTGGENQRGTTGRAEAGRAENRGREGYEGRAVPRVRNDRSRPYVEPRAYGYGRPHVEIPVRRFNRPYYVFRPHFLIGYGIYLGYPVPYPVVYGDPTYVYDSPYGEVTAPAPGDYGGMSFDITPDDAAVSVDGAYVGTARDFSPSYQPLTLTPGRHHIELQAEGMVPLAFDLDVLAGEVLPYRGALRPY